MARGQRPARRGLADGSIDAGLCLLETMVRGKRLPLTHKDIAYVCGCHVSLIWRIERQAIEKLKRALAQRGYQSVTDLFEGGPL